MSIPLPKPLNKRIHRFRIDRRPFSGRGDAAVDISGHQGPEDRTDDGDPAIGPVAAALMWDGHELMDDARAEVASGIDGIAGRAAE